MLPAHHKWTGYIVRKTLVADKSCGEIKCMGGWWAIRERRAAIDKLKSVFVPQCSPYQKGPLQHLSLLLCIPGTWPSPRGCCASVSLRASHYTDQTLRRERGKEEQSKAGGEINTEIGGVFSDFTHSLGKRTQAGAESYLNTDVLRWQLYGEAVLGQEPDSLYLWFKNSSTGERQTFTR